MVAVADDVRPSDRELALRPLDALEDQRFSNDELRQKFVDATVPQGLHLGLTFPDLELRFDEAAGHWTFGEIDWTEFKEVVAGNGPCNRQRRARQKAHDNGAWVREAAMVFAEKRRRREPQAEAA